MSITDELREWAKGSTLSKWTLDKLLAIADRIDVEHDREMIEIRTRGWSNGYDEGFASADDWLGQHEDAMAEHGWYRALDADKKPIYLGDKVYQVKGGWVYTVKSISFYPDNTTVTFACEHGFGNDSAHNLRHYHAPTVEDVLREFAYGLGVPVADSYVAAAASKLRLAGDAE